ncbi:hypothetical protein TNCV_4554321 [Trichonephila clavipes]|nr:hypothetical protein TNCV_4554321 [Trichonephila clavipes]
MSVYVPLGLEVSEQVFRSVGKSDAKPPVLSSQASLMFQNDIPIDVACHRYTLNMQVSSGTKNNSSPNEPSCTNGVVQWCSLGGNG